MAEPTPTVKREVDRLLGEFQDSGTFICLHGLVQANLLSATLQLGNGNMRAPDPDDLRVEAADIRYAASGLAAFLDALADRIAAASNGTPEP